MVQFMENENIWIKAINSLKERIGQQNFDIWIKPISFLSMDGESVQLEVPNRFFKEWINEHFSSQIQDVITDLTQKGCYLQFRIRNEKTEKKEVLPPPLEKKDSQTLHAQQLLFNPKYTFDNFIVGASNQFANAACLAVANLPGEEL